MSPDQTNTAEAVERALDELRRALRNRPENSWTTVSCEELFEVLESHDRLRSRIMDLETALGPFARAVVYVRDSMRDDDLIGVITCGELRAAARVLTEGRK